MFSTTTFLTRHKVPRSPPRHPCLPPESVFSYVSLCVTLNGEMVEVLCHTRFHNGKKNVGGVCGSEVAAPQRWKKDEKAGEGPSVRAEGMTEMGR